MKTCPKCNTENPDVANFCRKCGYDFNKSSESTVSGSNFTLDLFSDIPFQPFSVYEFISKKEKRSLIVKVFVALFFLLLFVVKFGAKNMSSLLYNDDFWIFFCVFVPVIAVFLFQSIKLAYRYEVLKSSAQYIEKSAMQGEFSRIAKNGKLGLYDTKKRQVLLSAKFDEISRFDFNHMLVRIGNSKGLFSFKTRTVIIPVKFDMIEPFQNSIAKAYKDNVICRYDVNGNVMV